MAKIEVRGLKELDAALAQLPLRVEKRLLGNALRAGGRVIAASARAAVPEDTGELKRSITVVGKRGQPGRAFIGFRKPRSRIAHLVEFGTRKMTARPFLRPALDGQASAAIRKIGENLAAGIAREAAKLRSRVR